MDQKKWGIIYCPKSGSFRPQKRWEKIEKALRLNHIDYDFVQSEQSKPSTASCSPTNRHATR